MRALAAMCFAALLLATIRQTRASSAFDLEQRGDYQAALQANPRLSAAWIDAGLAAESAHQIQTARSDLLEAARVDHRYLPAWTLAGFFYRNNDPAEFWPWARRAAELAYDDPRPLLELAQGVEPDPAAALRKLGAGDRFIRADLDLLVAARQWSAAQQVARLLLARHDPADRPRLIEIVQRQIGAGNAGYALELWRAFYPARLLSNGALSQQPSGLGFDWRLPQAQGITPQWTPGILSFDFDGAQCEQCSLLEQILPAEPHALRYLLTYQARTAGLTAPTNLRWDFGGHASAPLSPASDWTGQAAAFPAPRDALTSLRLLYRREPGTVRAEGRLELRQLEVEALP